ncbi:uncharacterized protein [Nicotiana sylvestris]|uniref:uncharacterized protein n=1 Tax=Nicotiana sylvestris TaxID=4096 RepID=UPI00388C46A9
MVEGSRQWHEKLPFALFGYCTTIRTSMGETPYLLVYGTEAVIPAEVEIPSLRIVAEAEIEDDEWVKTRLEQLSLIDEKRLAAVCHGQLYQKRTARVYKEKFQANLWSFADIQQGSRCDLGFILSLVLISKSESCDRSEVIGGCRILKNCCQAR